MKKILLLLIGMLGIIIVSANTGFTEESVPLINEVITANGSTIHDEDEDYRDWLEILNPGDSPVNLEGYGLSDDEADLFRWVFPSIILEPGEHLMVFASGKNRTILPDHFETVIDWGDEWRYLEGTFEPSPDWRELGFDDTGWKSGPSGFGYGDTDDATSFGTYIKTVYIRKSLTVDDVANITHGILQIDYDDGFAAYLNGTEIARSDLFGEVNVPPRYNIKPNFDHEAYIYRGENPKVFKIRNIQSLLVEGENVLAIQAHNIDYRGDVILYADLTVIPFLTLGMTSPPSNPRGVPEILEFSVLYYLHTNFKISSESEKLLLTDRTGNTLDVVEVGKIPPDFSWGRYPDGGSEWALFDQPTPGENNGTPGFQEFSNTVEVSPAGGFYYNNVEIILSVDSSTAEIHYTLDGNDPTKNSNLYSVPISINTTTVLKARAYSEGYLPGEITTHTYFINEEINLPVISLSTPPANLWDDKTGIYVKGTNTDLNNNNIWDANYGTDWEKPVHLEFYEADGNLEFSVDAGIRIVGDSSRSRPQKSFAVFFRGQYGCSELNYQIFPDLPINSFKALVLRNSGNDWVKTMMRDAMIHTLIRNVDLDTQAYRPAVLYINGEYWGIHNIREKLNEDYLASHHGIDPDNVDIVAPFWRVAGPIVVEGDIDHYFAMKDFLENHDMSIEENYQYIKTQMYVNNFIDYQTFNIFVGNYDFPGNNVKAWRPRTTDGKWRWMIYDVDYGFGGYRSQYSYNYNFIEHFTNTVQIPENWPNPPYSTLIFRKLLENQSFRNEFINRFADLMNTVFDPGTVKQKIREIKKVIEPGNARHLDRWEGSWHIKLNMSQWNFHVNYLELFADFRPLNARNNISEFFNLSGTANVNLDISQSDGGKIKLNILTLESFPWDGIYFKEVPIQLTALPDLGYRFTGWSGVSAADTSSITITLTEDVSVIANFEKDSAASNTIVMNEINYNSSIDINPEDWVELYNPLDSPVDISGWIFKDSNDTNEFVFPANTVITSGGYLVLCNNTAAFHTVFPDVDNYIGDLAFNLSNASELIRLYNDQGAFIDSLTYDDSIPWPVEPDGTGYTLALQDPNSDNSLPENWTYSSNYGTPGAVNDWVSGVDEIEVPIVFSLGQNYPNPFNPMTTIPFSLPRSGRVTIEVYSILGQLVYTILEEHMNAGHHSVVFNSYNLANGIYFYTIKASGFKKTKSMLLLK